MSVRPSWFVPLLLALSLLAAAGRAETPPAPQRVPAGVTPLPAAQAKHLEDLLRAAEKYRGLKALKTVPAGSLSARTFKRQMTESLPRDFPPEALKALEVSLKAFGLIPEKMDLRRYLPELMSSQVAGFYDPERKYLAVVDPGGASGKAIDQDMVLVHELTHAIQDQHFDLHRFEDHDPLSDGGTARSALVEGDAMLTMMDANLQASLEALPGADAVMDKMMQDPEKLLEATPDLPGAKEMTAAPVWIRDTLLFSYLQGAAFCVSTKRHGGQALLDYAFTTDPPRSTEQILHPEKWHTRRDDPVGLRFPDLAADLPGYRKAAEGEMGELSLRIFLREGLKETEKTAERANTAAAGWGGDRFAVYEKDGGRLVVWITEWDTEADAGEFRSALQALGGWRVEAASPSRVLAVWGSLPEERWVGVRARLAAVAAEKPVNKEIDLKAIGAAPVEMDLAALKELFQNPAVLEAIKRNVAKEKAAGEVSADGRVYTNRLAGFSIQVPESLQGWKVDGNPADPQTLVSISSPNSALSVSAGHQHFPKGVPAESASGLIEMGMKALPGYRRLRQETVEKSGARFQDIWFEAALNGKKLAGSLRYLPRSSEAFFIIAMGQAGPWEREQASILAILDTFALLPPESGAP
jgi:hypothetical protein